MSGIPLHPMLVHFPLVLAVLFPIFAFVALWAIRRGARPGRAWLLPVAVIVALGVSGMVAIRTGAAEEEKVERVVSSAAIEHHETHATQFILLAAVVGGFALLGLARGVVGESARIAASIGSFVLLGYGIQVGRAGGELAYSAGAAAVYSQPTALPFEMQEDHDE